MLFNASQKISIFTMIKNNRMAGIDDDLMDGGNIFSSQNNHNSSPQKGQTYGCPAPPKRGRGIDLLFQIIHYLIDAAMILLSFYMVGMEVEAYKLVFCVGLIIWMAYRILYFSRSNTIDIIIGLFLFAATMYFCIRAIDYYNSNVWYDDVFGNVVYPSNCVGTMLIPTVYLGFFCVWGAIRQNRNANEENDK